jgi:hypothetical protein
MTKLKISIATLVLIFHLSGCKDEDLVIPYFDFILYSAGMQEYGNAKAIVFDKTWQATAYIFPYAQDTQFVSLRLETYTLEGELRDVIYFGNFALNEGAYEVTEDASAGLLENDNVIFGGYAQFIADGDVIYGSYELDERHQPSFVIDRVDTVTQIIEGRFDVLFKLKDEYSNANLAKLIRFEGGEFTVNY